MTLATEQGCNIFLGVIYVGCVYKTFVIEVFITF